MLHPTLRLGSGYPDLSPYLRGEVQILQRALGRWGYTVPADGEFGPKTETAVRSFQRRQGFRDDGIVGNITWASVLSDRATPNGAGSDFKPPGTNQPPVVVAPPSTSASAGLAWMDIAKKEVGQHEVAGKSANPRILEYHAATDLKAKSDEVAWCSSFVNWCMTKAGIKGTRSAAAASWTGWGVASQGKPGSVTVIYNPGSANSSLSRSGNHVAFLLEETSTHLVLLGGNQSDSVKVSNFAKKSWRVKAYRWPPAAAT